MHKNSSFYKRLLAVLILLLCCLTTSLARRGGDTKLPRGTCVECGVLRPNQFYNLEKSVAFNELPWTARLLHNNSDIKFVCHGVLITNCHVVVTAHCLRPTAPDAVVLGYNGPRDTGASAHEINTFLIHPRYNPQTSPYSYDMGLIVLKAAVMFSDRIRPICLPDAEDRNREYAARHLPLTGWASRTQEKRKTFVLVMDQRNCQQHNPWNSERDVMICANTCDNGSKFVSGSALMDVKVLDGEPHHYYLIGLLIYGPVDCMDFKPDHFQRIDTVLDWIVSVVESFFDHLKGL